MVSVSVPGLAKTPRIEKMTQINKLAQSTPNYTEVLSVVQVILNGVGL
jgi:hypothetical protein